MTVVASCEFTKVMATDKNVEGAFSFIWHLITHTFVIKNTKCQQKFTSYVTLLRAFKKSYSVLLYVNFIKRIKLEIRNIFKIKRSQTENKK